MTRYKMLKIIKHALQYYIERPNASENDILEERKALMIVENEVEELKQKYNI